jgi:hypothetical protein
MFKQFDQNCYWVIWVERESDGILILGNDIWGMQKVIQS